MHRIPPRCTAVRFAELYSNWRVRWPNLSKTRTNRVYYAEPQREGAWNSVSEFTVLHFEVGTLVQDCETWQLLSVTGKSGVDRNPDPLFKATTHVCIERPLATIRHFELQQSERKVRQLYNDSDLLKFRDKQHQMDSALGEQKKSCDLKLSELYTVRGEDKLFIALPGTKEIKTFWSGPDYRVRLKRMWPCRSSRISESSTAFSAPVITLEEYFSWALQ